VPSAARPQNRSIKPTAEPPTATNRLQIFAPKLSKEWGPPHLFVMGSLARQAGLSLVVSRGVITAIAIPDAVLVGLIGLTIILFAIEASRLLRKMITRSSEAYKSRECGPCKLVDGTIVFPGEVAYKLHTTHPHMPIITGPHLHLFVAGQTNECKCFWNKFEDEVFPPPPDPAWHPYVPMAN